VAHHVPGLAADVSCVWGYSRFHFWLLSIILYETVNPSIEKPYPLCESKMLFA
jgi:hypothetical protein